MTSSAAGSFSVTMDSFASSVDDERRVDQLVVHAAGERRLGQARADARGDFGHGHGGIEFFLAAVGQCDCWHRA